MDPLEIAEEEWANVAEIVPTFKKDVDEAGPMPRSQPLPSRETPLMSVDRALEHFRATITEKPSIESIIHRRIRPKDIFGCGLCTKTSLKHELRADLALSVALTQTPFDDQDPKHFHILLTLYKQLTGDKVDCPRYGSHWEQIGFQGNDPATDMRGVGCLGLLQPLSLIMSPDLFPMAQAVHKLSLNEAQEFPFMVLSINLTRIAFIALKDGLLNRLCNDEGDLWTGFNLFYAAVVFHYYQIWKLQYKTIKDSGYVLQEVENYCRKNVDTVMARMRKHVETAYTAEEKNRARENIKKRTVIKY